ncbi:hypothetical protein [Chromatium okenii]|uniref:hypothetical protein n=1 Tax=Chromatium okenii TaxID=61644 RepID=UPI0026EDE1DE|nr:hypothetical protein [Chromatium okenii]MBV5311539.1 hypothetical protein [Chromatium okenii]
MSSQFDTLAGIAIPALLDVFGRPAVHLNSDGDELNVIVMLASEVTPFGSYGERAETRWSLEINSASAAKIGDFFTLETDPTPDDPAPDPTVWQATQLLADDGLLLKFSIRKQL